MTMSDDLHSPSEVARRVEQVLEGAERAALEILREAQDRARAEDERLADRAEAVRGELFELGHVAADLASQVEAMRKQIEIVQREIDAASSAGAPAPQAPPRTARPAPPPLPDPIEDELEFEQDEEPVVTRTPAGIDDLSPERLVAMQMAAARCSREEVEDHLRRRYGVADPTPILDELYGREAV